MPLAKIRFTPGLDVAALGFEPGDSVQPDGEVTRYLLHLEPSATHAGDRRTLRADHDEIVLDAQDGSHSRSSAPRVGITHEKNLPVAFGKGTPRQHAAAIDLADWTEAATIPASEPVDCHTLAPVDAGHDPGAGDLCEPHLRIWYVSAPQSRTGAIDLDLRARLRALGCAE